MTTNSSLTNSSDAPIRIAFIIGIAAGLLSLAGFFVSGSALFFQAYLFAFIFWIGISLGALALLLLHILTGNRWGLAIRRIAEAGANKFGSWLCCLSRCFLGFQPCTSGLVRLLSLPIQPSNYKSFYLNVPFFIGRAVLYFIVWILLALFANRWIQRRTASASPGGNQGLGAGGLILVHLDHDLCLR